jgi:VIT1/CCC1 family predicted Fe2+/Mn2+ transporter
MTIAKNLFEEQQVAWLYRVIASCETNPTLRRLFLKLAERANIQAGLWEAHLKEQGRPAKVFHPTWRARLISSLVRALGPKPMRSMLASMKVRGLSAYTGSHFTAKHPLPQTNDEIGTRHSGMAGGNLRATVFGINDGLVSNTSLIMGMAGANHDVALILLSGIAGMLAGALSMASGEYVSMRSQRELFEHQIDLERAELALYPEEEAEELALIYAARGMNLHEARRFTQKLVQQPEQALDLLSREELGLNPKELGSPWSAAIFSFLAFTLGALIPLIPFIAQIGLASGIQLSAGLAGVSLFVTGAFLSFFTGNSALYGGLRMLLIGAAAALTTYGIGSLFGVKVE